LDLPSLFSELQLRGFGEDKIDSALRCMVHVYAVQEYVKDETGGILAEDLVNSYGSEVLQAASELVLEKSMVEGREIYRVKWGCEDAAKIMEQDLWENGSGRWSDFVSELDDRYLGICLPEKDDGARVVNSWKQGKELKWFAVEVPHHGYKVLGMMDDIIAVATKLDLAFGFRPVRPEGVGGEKVLLHEDAYLLLKERGTRPPEELLRSIRLWRFFSEYDVHGTDFVALMRDCGLSLDDVSEQVRAFFGRDLTSQYRESQYPPYFINPKKKKEFQAAVRELLVPMEVWISENATAIQPLQSEGPRRGEFASPDTQPPGA
jgi:hypothetical protein